MAGSGNGEEPESGRGKPDEGEKLAGRRTLGPAARPGSRYSMVVGLGFLLLIVVALFNTLSTEDSGTLGLEDEETDLPLAQFAVPLAVGNLEGDANIAQDDCETGELPCPLDAQRTPACEVAGQDVIRICDFFDKPLVISFWFTRGGECEAQQDIVSDVAQRYRGRVGFLSLNVRDEREQVRDLVVERGWKMPVGHDRDGAVSNLYRVGGCPTFAFAYPGGILARANIGELSADDLDREVTALLRDSRRKAAADR